MTVQIACPTCGETDDLRGTPGDGEIMIACGSCGGEWLRDLTPSCSRCGSIDLQEVPVAIVEKGRGTQLSVVGIRTVRLCSSCDAATLTLYHRNRPNPLLPDELPTIDGERADGR